MTTYDTSMLDEYGLHPLTTFGMQLDLLIAACFGQYGRQHISMVDVGTVHGPTLFATIGWQIREQPVQLVQPIEWASRPTWLHPTQPKGAER